MNELIERAIESIDDLDAAIHRFNTNSVSVDGPTEPSNGGKKVGPYGIPEEIIRHCEIAIETILGALSSGGRTVNTGVSSRPPKWWRDVRRCAENQRLKDAATKQALADAVFILERHVGEDTPCMAGLVFLIGNLESKVKSRPSRVGLRSEGNPYSNDLIFFFDPEIDSNIDCTVKESLNKVVIPSKPCVGYLRTILDEIESL